MVILGRLLVFVVVVVVLNVLCRIKKCKLIHVVMTHWAGQVCIVNSLKIVL